MLMFETDPITINSKQIYIWIYLQTPKHVKRSGAENISVVKELSGTPRPHAAVLTA